MNFELAANETDAESGGFFDLLDARACAVVADFELQDAVFFFRRNENRRVDVFRDDALN